MDGETKRARLEDVMKTPTHAGLGPASTVEARDGSQLQVDCVWDGLFALVSGDRVGFRLRPCVSIVADEDRRCHSAPLNALEPSEAETVDHAVIKQALLHVPTMDRSAAVIVPIAFSTLALKRGQERVIADLLALAGRTRSRPIIEMRNLGGVDANVVADVVAQIRPGCGGVLAEVEADKASVVGVAGCGLDGLVLRTVADWQADARLARHFGELTALGRGVARRCIGRSRTVEGFRAMRQAGFTHAYTPSSPVVQNPDTRMA